MADTQYIPISVYCRLAPVRTPQVVPHTIEGPQGPADRTTMTVSDPTTGAWVQVGFEDVFEHDASQESVFDVVARPLMGLVREGYNAALLAYGQTSSGKTHTMLGPNGGDTRYLRDNDRGIIPRVIEELLSHSNDHVEVSYLEIYNEVVTDLIAKVRARGNPDVVCSYRGTERNRIERSTVRVRCHSSEECMGILEEVSSLRRVGSTDANLVSSRSHVIIQIRYGGGGKLSLVDLAGSECIKKSNPKGIRMNETRNINTSLFALKKVIHSLYKQNDHIPYKDSILTAVLEDSLGGSAVTSLLVSCSSKSGDISETIATLRFAAEASCVKSKPRKVAVVAMPTAPPTTATPAWSTCSDSNASYEVESLRQCAHKLSREKDDLHSENAMLSEQCTIAARERDAVESRVQSLQAEMTQIFALIDAVKLENETLRDARAGDEHRQSDVLDGLRREINSLHHVVADARHHKEQAISLTKEVDILRVEKERLTVMLSDRTMELEGGGLEAQRLEVQCNRLVDEYNIMVGVLREHARSVEVLERQLHEERTQGVAFRDENVRLREHNRQLQRVNEQLSIEHRRGVKQLQSNNQAGYLLQSTVRIPLAGVPQQQSGGTLTYFESPLKNKENAW